MKNYSQRKSRLLLSAIGAVAGCLAASSALASSTLITFQVDMGPQITNASNPFNPSTDTVYVQGTFNGWSPYIQLFQEGSSTIYTNTYNDTAEPNGGRTVYQFNFNSATSGTVWEKSADSNLRAALLPTTSGASLILPVSAFNDAYPAVTTNLTFRVDLAQQISLGNFIPGTDTVEVRGNFNGWTGGANPMTNNPADHHTNAFGLVSTNVYEANIAVTGPTNGAMDYKFVISHGGNTLWDSPTGNNTDNGGNRWFTQPYAPASLPIADFSDAPYAPLVAITFNVDMSAVQLADPGFSPTSVTLNGDFNGWSTGIACTNDPNGSNTNLYSCTITNGAGSTINYQFRYLSYGNTVYDNPPGGGNRQISVPNVATLNVPPVYFNNVSPNDLLNVDTVVTFTIAMSNAVTTDNIHFDPSQNTLYLNGDFAGWVDWNPLALSSANLTCTNNPPGSSNWSCQVTIPKYHSRSLSYRFAVDPSGVANEPQNPNGKNHFRYIRSTNGTYNLPLDTWGVDVVEPKFGNLTIGAPSGGQVPLNWLGYPGASLVSGTDISQVTNVVAGTSGQSSATIPTTNSTGYYRLYGPQ